MTEDDHHSFQHADIVVFEACQMIFSEFGLELDICPSNGPHLERSMLVSSVFDQSKFLAAFTHLALAMRYWRGLGKARDNFMKYSHIRSDWVSGLHAVNSLFAEHSNDETNASSLCGELRGVAETSVLQPVPMPLARLQ